MLRILSNFSTLDGDKGAPREFIDSSDIYLNLKWKGILLLLYTYHTSSQGAQHWSYIIINWIVSINKLGKSSTQSPYDEDLWSYRQSNPFGISCKLMSILGIDQLQHRLSQVHLTDLVWLRFHLGYSPTTIHARYILLMQMRSDIFGIVGTIIAHSSPSLMQ